MNEANRKVYCLALRDIELFTKGDLDLEEIQRRLEVALGLLEREPISGDRTIRETVADLEFIQFCRLASEQRPAAIFRLDPLRDEIRALLDAEPLSDGSTGA